MIQKLFLIFNYFNHKIKAGNEHRIHSPFLFDLYVETLADPKNFYAFTAIEKERQALLKNTSTISITDFGAGSTVNNNKQRKVSEIAKHALKPKKQSQFLYRLCNHIKPNTVIELGTSLGITTSYLAHEDAHRSVYTLEGCPETLAIAEDVFEHLHLKNIETIQGDFKVTLPLVLDKIDTVDLVYFDGNHQYQPTLDYFNLCLPKVNANSVFIFDDIYWSSEMKKAWQEIKAHPDVMLSVDLFWFGIVFFRKNQPKQDFVLKFKG